MTDAAPPSPQPAVPGASGGVRVVVSCALQDAGEATRSVALAGALRHQAPDGTDMDVVVLTHGSRFEPLVAGAGFRLHRCPPTMEGRSVVDDLGWAPPEITDSVNLAESLIRGERAALEDLRPDLVLHGFWPFANVAARMLEIPTVCFLPLPLHPVSVAHGLLDDLPDEAPAALTGLPRPLRRGLARLFAPALTRVVPAFRQHNLPVGAHRAGWEGPPLRTVFDLLDADLTVVNDLPDFYGHTRLSPQFRITGPVMAEGADLSTAPADIVHLLTGDDPRPSILLTMGSSGTKEAFLEALRAVADPRWRTVVLASPAICTLSEARSAVPGHDGLVITDAFVPAPAVTRLVDLVVSHGGQGTVQTTLAAGVPTVGVGMQVEQQINLQHVERHGAGVRIPRRQWCRAVIAGQVERVLRDPDHRAAAGRLARRMGAIDGPTEAAKAIWSGPLVRASRAALDP